MTENDVNLKKVFKSTRGLKFLKKQNWVQIRVVGDHLQILVINNVQWQDALVTLKTEVENIYSTGQYIYNF